MNVPSRPRSGPLRPLLAACAAALPAVACAGHRPVGGPGEQAYYQTAFPTFDTSEALRRTFESVRRIQITATYTRYAFAPDAAPPDARAGIANLLRGAVDTTTVTQSRAATVVALSRNFGNLALLTADHALEFPDTIVEIFEDDAAAPYTGAGPTPSRRVESVSIKTHQTNWVLGATLENFEVLARDRARDLALIGVREPPEVPAAGLIPGGDLEDQIPRTPVLSLPAGNSERLTWGSFVYVLGYPQGYPMVTRGIVSPPSTPASPGFLVDGLWNRGMSGGLIVAVRGDGQGLEWVGVARSAASTTEVRLVPADDAKPEPGVRSVYRDEIYLQEARSIDYGIMFSVPTDDVRSFLAERRAALGAQGFTLPEL